LIKYKIITIISHIDLICNLILLTAEEIGFTRRLQISCLALLESPPVSSDSGVFLFEGPPSSLKKLGPVLMIGVAKFKGLGRVLESEPRKFHSG
jgi:hypothetical protein